MNQWTALLERHAAAAGPRSFEGVLRRVRRRRQRQVLGAAVGVLLVVGGAALAAARPTSTARPQPGATSAPDTIVVNGKTLHRDKLTPILSVSAPSRDDHLLVLVAGYRDPYPSGPTYCDPWTVPYVLRQTATTVVVGAYDYLVPRPPPPGGGCFGTGHSPATLTVDLGTALGGRRVVDESSGAETTTIVESDFLTTARLPDGYGDRRFFGGRNPGFSEPYLSQTWTGPGGAELNLVEGPPAEVIHVHVQHVGTAQVRGRFGQLVRTAGGTANRCLRWDEGPGDAVELCTRGYSQQLLTVEGLVAFADLLRRPGAADVRQQAPASIQVQGRTLEVQGGAAFAVGYLDPAQPQDIVVHLTTPGSVGGCFTWPVLRVVSQSPDQVAIGVFEYQVAKPVCVDAMPDTREDAPYLRVALAEPLGRRRLIDVGAGGLEALVIDPTQWLTAGRLPAGYSDRGQIPFRGERGGGGSALVTQTWAGSHGLVQLVLQQGQATALGGDPVSHVTVRGHVGTYSSAPGRTFPVRCLSWLERANDRVVLCSNGGDLKRTLPDAELLSIAEGLRPRTT
ncbi:MAG: hypothetical protein JWO22_250 [Frankiales bacterium]|nr:hypothetical protein [Frankiales bacterium]